VDDFTDWKGTRDAVFDYLATHGLAEKTQLHVTWHDAARDAAKGEVSTYFACAFRLSISSIV